MADLPEISEWVGGIYQIENNDPVSGGLPDIPNKQGINNAAAQQLANRTLWLKGQLGGLGGLADTVTDLDALAKSGLFQFSTGAVGNPVPGTAGGVWHTENSGGRAQQLVLSDSGDTYSRHRTDATPTWTAWRRILDNKQGDGLLAASGYDVLPSGLIMQWGNFSAAASNSLVSYPIAFPNGVFTVLLTDQNSTPNATSAHIVGHRNVSQTNFRFTAYDHTGTTPSGTGGSFLALGY